MRRNYSVWSAKSCQVVEAVDARHAVKLALERWRMSGFPSVKVDQVVVNVTRELVPPELWT